MASFTLRCQSHPNAAPHSTPRVSANLNPTIANPNPNPQPDLFMEIQTNPLASSSSAVPASRSGTGKAMAETTPFPIWPTCKGEGLGAGEVGARTLRVFCCGVQVWKSGSPSTGKGRDLSPPSCTVFRTGEGRGLEKGESVDKSSPEERRSTVTKESGLDDHGPKIRRCTS